MKTILKATSKGQITLPAKWRKSFNTTNFIAKEFGDVLEIRPIDIDKLEKEQVIFDAFRDNNGKGIDSGELIKILKSIK